MTDDDPVTAAEAQHVRDVRDTIAAEFAHELDLVKWEPLSAGERASNLASERRQLLAATLSDAYGLVTLTVMPPSELDQLEHLLDPLVEYLATDRPDLQPRPRRRKSRAA